MNSFLKTVAYDLFAKLEGNFERVSVVFPNKRASLFFERNILEQMGQHLWAPTYHALNDVFSHLSNKNVADPILLNCLLYRAHCDVVEALAPGKTIEHETLDRFYPWGEVMLADFNDIDNNMANAEKIFSNVKDLEELKSFDYFTDNHLEAISTYFDACNGEHATKLKTKFHNIWATLYPTYVKFRDMLNEQSYAYSGMQKREVVEFLEGLNDDETPTWIAHRTFVFVGFNVLNETERRLLLQLRRLTKVMFYWDYDQGYLKNNNDTIYEAGRFMRENISTFPNELDTPSVPLAENVFDNLSRPKRVRLIETSTETQQARFAGNELNRTWQRDEALNETAIVLCNEAVLQPMLHSLPEQYKVLSEFNEEEKKTMPVNITMGFPLSETPVVSFLTKLMEMQLFGHVAKGWRYRYVMDVLLHPYATYLLGDDVDAFRKSIVEESKYIIPDDDPYCLKFNNIFTLHATHTACLQYLADLTKTVGLALRQTQTDDFLTQLYAESVFEAYRLINRLIGLVEQTHKGRPLLDVQGNLLLRLLSALLRQRTIPFHGEPAEGVQVLGLLETRNIDFKRVVLLSANEGVLPAKNQRASFIPYTLREVYGMTTQERQISLAAYYFYRLISRAEDIAILYNGTTEVTQTGEVSRFVSQLLVEYAPGQKTQTLFSPETRIQRMQLDACSAFKAKQPFEVRKTDAILQKLLSRYDISQCHDVPTEGQETPRKVSYLSPSALSTYMNCPMQFYFKYVAGLFEEDELTEEFDNRIFGLVFHGCMEMLYQPFLKGKVEIQSSKLQEMAKDLYLLESTVDKAFAREYFKVPEKKLDSFVPHYSGEQLITRAVILEYVKKQLRYDALCCPMSILGLETKAYEYHMSIDLKDLPNVKVRLGGIIDRLDYAMQALKSDKNGNLTRDTAQRYVRVVDYKTSNAIQTTKSIDDLFDNTQKKRAAYIFQTLYYCYVLAQKSEFAQYPIKPYLMYVKLANEIAEMDVKIDKEVVNDFVNQDIAGESLMQAFAEKLKNLVRDIFDPNKPFVQAENESNCKYCPFKEICGRKELMF
ncbi:MAG: PD-(D/E)XK nuclease family protein [Bacteroidaceae bacterium]|nr:PD-(D/E)XK nuclease family protein [Bacteroidaceae bacterium]